MKRKRINRPRPSVQILLGVLFALMIWPMGCNRQNEGEEAVAWVNGEPILFSVFWEEIKSRYNERPEFSSPEKEVLKVLKKNVCSDLIRERLLLQEAAKRGISIPETELKARLDDIQKDYTRRQFRKTLINSSKDYEQWKESIKNNMILQALFNTITSQVPPVNDTEIKDYYNTHQDEFLMPETVSLSQIVVKDRSLAKKLHRRLKKGENFRTLASLYSIGPEKSQAGKLGAFGKGELPEPLEKAAFSTPPNKITPLVETRHGFHILKIESRQPAHLMALEEAKEQLTKKLLNERQEVYYNNWVDTLTGNSDIRVHRSLIDLMMEKATTQEFSK